MSWEEGVWETFAVWHFENPQSVALAYSKLCATFCPTKVIIIKAILFGQAKNFHLCALWQRKIL